MIKVYDKRAKAKVVLEILLEKIQSESYLTEEENKKMAISDISIGSYQNGREQGMSLNCYFRHKEECSNSLWIAFSEARRSDQIVVYLDNLDPCQSISDKAYENGKYFSTPHEAAEYIDSTIRQFLFQVVKQNIFEEGFLMNLEKDNKAGV